MILCTHPHIRLPAHLPCRDAVFAFVDLLDMSRDPAFQCPICRHLRHKDMCIALDGITLGFAASMRQTYTPPAADDSVAEEV